MVSTGLNGCRQVSPSPWKWYSFFLWGSAKIPVPAIDREPGPLIINHLGKEGTVGHGGSSLGHFGPILLRPQEFIMTPTRDTRWEGAQSNHVSRVNCQYGRSAAAIFTSLSCLSELGHILFNPHFPIPSAIFTMMYRGPSYPVKSWKVWWCHWCARMFVGIGMLHLLYREVCLPRWFDLGLDGV